MAYGALLIFGAAVAAWFGIRSQRKRKSVWVGSAIALVLGVGSIGSALEPEESVPGHEPGVRIEADPISEDPGDEPQSQEATAQSSDEEPEPAATSVAAKDLQPSAGMEDVSELLETIPIKGRAPKTGYDRAKFGPRWADVDRNGCDTRNDILGRDLTDKTYKDGTHACVVLTGTLEDPYTGKTIMFERGQDTSMAVQIDHVVALSDAWQKGAQLLSEEQRTQFANDRLNLYAVDGPANQQKGAGDAATWLPSNKAFRCTYVASQVQVKAKYRLWVTQAEHDAIARVLSSCDELAVEKVEPVEVVTPEPVDPDPEDPGPAPAPPQEESSKDVYYQNCTEARAAGAAPIYEGEPGYRKRLDRDGDGIACE